MQPTKTLTPTGIAYNGTLSPFQSGVHYQFGPYHRVGTGPWFRSWDARLWERMWNLRCGRLPQ